MTPRRHRLSLVRPRATLLTDDELLEVLLQLLYRRGYLELGEMVAAVRYAEWEKGRRSMPIALRLAGAVCPSGAA